jgi:hypothetical protein
MKKLGVVLFAALLMFAWGSAQPTLAAGKVVRLTLIDENGSGEDGSAQLTDQGDGTTKVELIMLNAPEGADQPAHIHKGTCANLDANPAYPLNDVKEGKSTTMVKVALTELTAEHYAINVHKSPAEIGVYVSCGNLPLGSATTGPLTVPQALDQLLDKANELAGSIKKREVDASQNAYDQYHTVFAANEEAIKVESSETQAKLEDAMHAVQTALQAGKFDEADGAAQALITTINGARAATSSVAAPAASAGLTSAMSAMGSAAADLVRETGNKDTAGAQEAYDAFHTAFTAHQADLTAKAPDETAEMVAAQTEVQDALQAGDWAKASKAAGEIQKSVGDATGTMGITVSAVPATGAGDSGALPAFGALALALLGVGALLRRRATPAA